VIKEKKLYIWNHNMTHVDASPNLEHDLIPEDSYYPGRKGYIWGVAEIKSGRLHDEPESSYTKNFISYHGINKIKDDWTTKYFDKSLFDTMKEEMTQ
jgi:hypothetical protein